MLGYCTLQRFLAELPLQFSHVQLRTSVVMSLAAEWAATACRNKPTSDVPVVVSNRLFKTVKKGQRMHLKSSLPTVFQKIMAITGHFEFLSRLSSIKGSKRNQREQKYLQCNSTKTLLSGALAVKSLCKGICALPTTIRTVKKNDFYLLTLL